MISIKGRIGRFMMRVFALFPLQKKVVFSSFDGNNYGDNPKAVFEKLQDIHATARIIWLLYDDRKVIEGANVVKAYSIKALYHQATAKVWVFNSRQREWMVKRKGQTYIQTWHGNIAMKKIEKDALDRLPEYYVKEAKHDSEMADFFISGSGWSSENYKSAFWYDGEILEVGIPRSDVFYGDLSIIKNKVFSHYKLEKDAKMALYAPTFRNNSKNTYSLNYQQLKKALEDKWPGKWHIVVRLHPNIQREQSSYLFDEGLLNGSTYPDINELIISSEIVITDYSSCMFDALEAKRKVLLYVPDLDEYTNEERGTYFTVDELPFLYATNNGELSNAILEFNEKIYKEKGRAFLEKCVIYNNGTAASQIAEIVNRILQ